MLEHFLLRWKNDDLLSVRGNVTHHKGRRFQHPSINPLMPGGNKKGHTYLNKEEMQPRQCWRLGKTAELIETKDKNIQLAKVHKTLLLDLSIVYILYNLVKDLTPL